MRFLFVAWLLVLPVPAQQGMGSTTKAIPRYSSKSAIPVTPPSIDLRDVASRWGITSPNVYGGHRTRQHILEMTGNGVALFDYDNDGKTDVLLVNGARLDGTSQPSVLYRNLGAGKFSDATNQAKLATYGWAQGVCAGDFDNDGSTDLLITRYGDNILLRNDHGQFRTLAFPSTPNVFNTGCSFLDYDRDGRLDLFTSSYVSFPPAELRRRPGSGLCKWLGLDVFCGPRGFGSGENHLYHNEGNGRFRDVSKSAGIQLAGIHYGLGVASADLDGDGWPDIYVACDSTPSILYRNNHDGTFSDVAVPAGTAYGDNGEEQGGMGVVVGDYDNDGKPDILRSNFIDETTTTLYRNLGEMFFSNQTVSAGHGVNTHYVAWGVQFIDVDQDGFRDVMVAAGHIYPELSRARVSEPFAMRRLLYWNIGNGAFQDVSEAAGPGVTQQHSSRGLSVGDLDGDGAPEIVIMNMNEAPTVLRNFGRKGNALAVKLTGSESNRSAIGATVTISAGGRSQSSTVTSGSSYLSQSEFRQHFGLGAATAVETLEILWPSGRRETLHNVAANREIRITEGRGISSEVPFVQAVH